MKRRFTFLTAAIALLTILAFPMGVWGQSDYSSDYTGNVTHLRSAQRVRRWYQLRRRPHL